MEVYVIVTEKVKGAMTDASPYSLHKTRQDADAQMDKLHIKHAKNGAKAILQEDKLKLTIWHDNPPPGDWEVIEYTLHKAEL